MHVFIDFSFDRARSLEKERMKLSSMNMLQLLFILIPAITVIAKDIIPGSKLYASNPKESWNSPNKLFSLSFIQESEGTYFAAITYNGVPIWKAGGDPGGAVSSSARLEFTANGNLLLFDDFPIVWKSNTQEQGITSASLENSGNLVLKIGNISQWTTFDNPTDTIIPGQSFTVNNVLRCGLYSFNLSSSGEVSLRWNNAVEYYASKGINNTGNFNMTSPSLSMQSEGMVLLHHSLHSSSVVMARGSDYGEASDNILRFVKLDCDGNVKMYTTSMSGRRGSKSVTWTAVSDQCKIFGYCGDFGICRYDEVSRNPICGCPSQNFLLNNRHGDRNRSCGKKLDIQKCQTIMLPLHNTLFLTFPPETDSDSFTANIADCSSNCLTNPSCVASSFLADGTGVCYMKRSRFISGYQSPAITSTSYVKVCEPAMPNPPISSRKVEYKLYSVAGLKIAVVVLGSSLVMVILVGCSLWLCCRSKPRYKSIVPQYTCADYASSALVQFSYKELQQQTKGFEEKIGEGGFGSVYRGVLPNKMVVAVKQLEGIGQGEKQFRMEVATISSTHHLNLVRLIGFCSEGKHRLLVYEFMKNGSLESSLFPSLESSSNKKALNWACRYSIALGTAKGITYLHEECRDCILHCGVKPENILLDEKYNARISDFGFSRLLNLNDQRHRSMIMVRGTRGYIAPEWMSNLPITSKADVYSYGMVLLEIVCGKRNFEVSPETNNKKFSLWAYEEFEKGNVVAVLDKRLMEEHDVDVAQAMRAIQVSFWCIQEHPALRPTMGKVVQMLEGIADIHKPPPPLSMVEGQSPQTSAATSSIYLSETALISSLNLES